MEVQVMDTLSGLLTNIGDNAVAVQTQLLGDLGNDGEDVSYYSGVILGYFSHGGNMGLGDDQEVRGSLRIDVIKGKADLVLVDFVGRDLTFGDLAEQTIRHKGFLLNLYSRFSITQGPQLFKLCIGKSHRKSKEFPVALI